MLHSNTSKLIEPRIFLLLLFVLMIAVVIFYFVTSMITSVGYQTFSDISQDITYVKNTPTIVIDAGHGGEDPGAIANNVIEKELNLFVANKVAEYLKLSGYHVVRTRVDDRLLYNDGEEDRKKYFDLKNRLEVVQGYESALFISVHMNKYPLENCKGLQTFYSTNHPLSEALAQSIQEKSKLVTPENQRLIKQDTGTIFLLKNIQTPAVLVECGFLSNYEEATLLSTPEYQDKIAFVICCGIINFIEGNA